MKPFEIYIPLSPGLEPYTLQELSDLKIPVKSLDKSGIAVIGHWNTLIKLNLSLKTISRVYIRLADFKAKTFAEFSAKLSSVDLSPYLNSSDKQVKVFIKINSYQSALFHENALENLFFKVLTGKYPDMAISKGSGDDHEPNQRFLINIIKDKVQISVDSSGDILYKRGYQQHRSEAPLRESIASAMYLACAEKDSNCIIDPFCGSGTIPIEIMINRSHFINDHLRQYAFMNWSHFDKMYYEKIIAEFHQNTLQDLDENDTASRKISYYAFDIDPKCVQSVLHNYQLSGMNEDFHVKTADFLNMAFNQFPFCSVIITNPPWGKRIQSNQLKSIYKKLETLAQKFSVYCLLPDANLSFFKKKKVLFKTRSGSIDVSFIKLMN